MELSKRLQAVADCITPGLTIADIGTDHGYIPIYLVENGLAPRAIAMDVNPGPLQRAQANIRAHALEDRVGTRLCDGIKKLCPKEADCVVIAGMGGGLMQRILEQDPENLLGVREWVFEPQSELEAFRRYLQARRFRTVREDMVEEDGKFYPILKAQKSGASSKKIPPNTGDLRSDAPMAGNSAGNTGSPEPMSATVAFRYGALLLENRHPVLKAYLQRERTEKERILRVLLTKGGARSAARARELEEDLRLNAEALKRYLS